MDKSTKSLIKKFAWLLVAFSLVLIAFQWQRERTFRREILEAQLLGYADVIAAQDSIEPPSSVQHLRTTVLTKDGKVLYESEQPYQANAMQNHLSRPEVQQALIKGQGYDIRNSLTTGEDFFYYAKVYNSRIVRVALPYSASVSHNLHTASTVFFLFGLLVFAGMSLVLIYTGGSVHQSISVIRKKEKARTQEVKKQISSNIAHELRTPVAAIHGYMETVIDNPSLSEEKKLHFIERALVQTDRLADLIRDVSLISKTEEAPSLLPREQLHVSDIWNEIVEELRPELSAADIKVFQTLPEDLKIEGNYSLFHAIFRNLVENTIRYAGKSVEVHLICEEKPSSSFFFPRSSSHVHFTYYDTGRGVAPEHLDRLFERFYRIDEGRSRNGTGGTGLGLSIVRNAVSYHGGEIAVTNRPEGGLQFQFTIAKA